MTADPVRGAKNRLLAAEAALAGGAVMQAQVLVEQAMPHLRAGGLESAARRVEGMTWARLGRPGLAAPTLFASATDLRSMDPELGRQTIVQALEQSMLSGGITEADRVLRTAIAAAALAEAPCTDTAVELAVRALATYMSDGFVEAAAHLRAILSEMSDNEVDPLVLLRWTLVISNAARALWDRDALRRRSQLHSHSELINPECGSITEGCATQACGAAVVS